jgi:hypothetical protein
MKITKILVALSFLFAISTAHAGEMTVTGSMQATYQSEVDRTTGNPLGMDREIAFTGTTELDSGISMTVMQDFGDDGTFGDAKITFGNVGGLVDIYVGTDGSELDAVDDITPTAFEEANGSGSGTHVDIGNMAAEMGIGFKASLPIIGTVSGQYIPKGDSAENADKAASGDTNALVGSGKELVVRTALGDVPFVGSYLDGQNLTLGYGTSQEATVANTSDLVELTAALTGSFGNFSYGYQRELIDLGQTVALTDAIFHKVETIGLAYAINDSLSVSYNTIESKRHNVALDNSYTTKTDAINIGYTVGGITIGFQDAGTDNANFVKDAKDDTRTLSIKAAF